MRILALEPYYGGSHRAFLDGWSQRSRHDWTLLGLPPRKWKWRMRHAAISFAEQVDDRWTQGERWDGLFCSDMLNLAEFLGLCPAPIRSIPTVVYFHENQLTYPNRQESERDYQFALTNLTTALAATNVWFNSNFHRVRFLSALDRFLRKMPDYRPLDSIGRVREKSQIQYPGIEEFSVRSPRPPGPLRILWGARWEHDKNPEDFFRAIERLDDKGIPFRLSVIGEQFRDSPKVFAEAALKFASRIDRWGYQENREDYIAALLECDVFVSTANHEFFGLGVVEAVAAGAFPLLPDRLSYPELFPADRDSELERFFYSGDPASLASSLTQLAHRIENEEIWEGTTNFGARNVERFQWNRRVPEMDDAFEGSSG